MNPFKPGSQNHRLLERLRRGPMLNTEIVRDMGIFNSTGRISEIRKKGFLITSCPIGDGLWKYKLQEGPCAD